jgi:hypothetical protein
VRQTERSELFYLNDEMARKIDNQMLIIYDFINLCLGKKSDYF